MTYQRGTNLLLLLTAALAFTGCRTLPSGPDPQADAPTYAAIAEVHNLRVQRLSPMYGRGVLEVRWRDEDGRHFEQGNLDIWLDLPRHTALRVEKVGSVFLWLGSNDDRFWLFDMLGDETVLLTAHHDSVLRGTGLLTVRPLVLLDLAGLTMLPELNGEYEPQVTHDAQRDAWVVTAPGQGGMMRLYFDRASLFPIYAESLDEAGTVLYQSEMRRDQYQSVPRPGAPPSAFGHMARRTVITATEPGNGIQSGELRITIDAPTGRVDNQPMDRVFDLDRLMRSMRPDRIEGDLPTMSPR
jgi:hypothetical protein